MLGIPLEIIFLFLLLYVPHSNYSQAKEKLDKEYGNEKLVKDILEFLKKCNRTLIKG